MQYKWTKHSILLFLFIFTFGNIMSQKMKVESFVELSDDIDAIDPTFRRIDRQASRNGQYCAIIKLVTTVQDKSFTFDLGSDLVPEDVVYQDNGEIWIYVPGGTGKIKISHGRYGQLDTRDGYYNFSESGISKCVGGTVYRLILHTDFNPDDDIIKDPNKLAKVRFHVNHDSATIILRKIPEIADENGVLEKQMPLGIYHYRVSLNNYHDVDGVFELTEENEIKEINVNLSQAYGWLILDSDFKADGYTFVIDDTITTISAIQKMALASGSHSIRVEHQNYYPETAQIVIQDSTVYEFLPQLQPRVGSLYVSVNQTGATILVDGIEVDVAPMDEPYSTIIGNHTVTVSYPNYKTETVSVNVEENKIGEISVNLVDIARYAFSSTPMSSSLYINDEYIGETPCNYDLASGDYNVMLTHKRYKTINQRMHFDSSNPNVSFAMKRQYQQPFQLYFQPTFMYAKKIGYGGTFGFYLANLNAEVMYLQKTFTNHIYWNYIGDDKNSYKYPGKERFTPSIVALNIGYGLVFGTRFRLTPQLGVNVVNFDGSRGTTFSALEAFVGSRVEFVLLNHLGLCVTPGYTHSIYKSDNYVRLSSTLSQLNDYVSDGFNVKMGLYLYF